MNTKYKQIVSRLEKDKEYRDLFVENEITVGVPFQIRAIREDRGWSQKELAERTGKQQSVISQLENPDYGKLTLSTLKALASAFDVGLMVRFAPFSELVSRAANLSEIGLEVPEFSKDWNLYFEQPVSTSNPKLMLTKIDSTSLIFGAARISESDKAIQYTTTTLREYDDRHTAATPYYLQ